jgi:hypothetical protein
MFGPFPGFDTKVQRELQSFKIRLLDVKDAFKPKKES